MVLVGVAMGEDDGEEERMKSQAYDIDLRRASPGFDRIAVRWWIAVLDGSISCEVKMCKLSTRGK